MDQFIVLKFLFAVVLLGTLGTSKPVSKTVRPTRSMLHSPKRTDVKRETPKVYFVESDNFRSKRELISNIRPKIAYFTQYENVRPKRSFVHLPMGTDVERETSKVHLVEGESFRQKRELMSHFRTKITDFKQIVRLRPKRSVSHRPKRTDVKSKSNGHLAEGESFRPKRERMSKIRPKITDFTQIERLRPKGSVLHRLKRTDVKSKSNGHLAEGESFRPRRELMSKIRPKITDFTQNERLRPKRSLLNRPKRTDVNSKSNGHLAEGESFRPKRELMSKILPKITEFTQNERLRPKRSLLHRPKRTDASRETPNGHLAKIEKFRPKINITRPMKTDLKQNERLRQSRRLVHRPKRTDSNGDTNNGQNGIRYNTDHTEGPQSTKRTNTKHEKVSVIIKRIRHQKSLLVDTDAHKPAIREKMKTARALEKTYLNHGSTMQGDLSLLEERLLRYLCRNRGQQSDRKKALCSEIELLEAYTRFWGNSALPPFPAFTPLV